MTPEKERPDDARQHGAPPPRLPQVPHEAGLEEETVKARATWHAHDQPDEATHLVNSDDEATQIAGSYSQQAPTEPIGFVGSDAAAAPYGSWQADAANAPGTQTYQGAASYADAAGYQGTAAPIGVGYANGYAQQGGITPPPGPNDGAGWPAEAGWGDGEIVGALSADELQQQKRKQKRRWAFIILALVCVGLLIAAGFIARAIGNSSTYGPEARAKAYLQAVVDGDVDHALELYLPNLSTDQRALLTSEVFGASSDRPTSFKIDGTTISGDTATVNADLTIDSKSYPMAIALQKRGQQSVIFDDWAFTDGGLQKITVSSPDAVDTVNGVKVQLGSANEISVLPGAYTFAPRQNSQYVTFGEPVTVKAFSPGDADAASVSFTETWSQLGRDYAINQVKSRIAECMQSDKFEPEGCKHLKMDDPGSYAVTGIHRSWSGQPTITFADETVQQSSRSGGWAGSTSSGQGSSGQSSQSGTARVEGSTAGSVVLTGGDMHIDYKWRYDDQDDWVGDSRVNSGVFDYTTVVPVSIGADGTPQLDFSSF
ncbi:hypothetical protein F8O07_03730 [Pseudoclavibacter sp. CFCC 13796]|uniref:hypothetical protein n=1 Tax=Pseudoclavibacter sp. CFCC 13796 TaxID=2615179 RepID=UPI0013014FD8|nr:hypothetical protein [Pseudoclavibacter sp. CFCC 13796]KAB1661077.1 hypothetical protein F8O07_03730 [Pseudoclavibacter sp. CFCC 13796]